MKMKMVQNEMPVFDDYEFDGYRTLKPVEDKNVRVFFDCPENEHFLDPITYPIISPKHKYFFYKKKPPRKIIYQEVREDHLKRGDFYRDDDGDVNMWISDMQSREKHPILKKVYDGFGENHD